MLWLNGHALTASPTSYSHLPSPLLKENYFSPPGKHTFLGYFRVCLSSAPISLLRSALLFWSSVSLPQDSKVDVGVSTKEGCATSSLCHQLVPPTARGKDVLSLEPFPTWVLLYTSQGTLQAQEAQRKQCMNGHGHDLHYQHWEDRMIQSSMKWEGDRGSTREKNHLLSATWDCSPPTLVMAG